MTTKSAYQIGMTYELKRIFNAKDLEDFALISGDTNPIHLDPEFAKSTKFKSCVVHGALTNALFSTIFGTIFPGPGGIYVSQSTKFLRPVYLNQEITAKVQLIDVNSKNIATFTTQCFDKDQNLLLAGEAKLLLP